MKKLTVLLLLLFFPITCFAQSVTSNAPDINDMFTPLISLLAPIGMGVMFFMVTIFIYRMVTSGQRNYHYESSSPKKVTKKQELSKILQLETKQEEDTLLNTKISFPSSVKEVIK